MHDLFANARDEKDFVVHREAEEHAHQQDRHKAQNRARVMHVERTREPSPLKHRDDRTERGTDREHVTKGRLDRHPHRTAVSYTHLDVYKRQGQETQDLLSELDILSVFEPGWHQAAAIDE